MITDSETSEFACRRLIDWANQDLGEDKITVIVSKPDQNRMGQTTLIQ